MSSSSSDSTVDSSQLHSCSCSQLVDQLLQRLSNLETTVESLLVNHKQLSCRLDDQLRLADSQLRPSVSHFDFARSAHQSTSARLVDQEDLINSELLLSLQHGPLNKPAPLSSTPPSSSPEHSTLTRDSQQAQQSPQDPIDCCKSVVGSLSTPNAAISTSSKNRMATTTTTTTATTATMMATGAVMALNVAAPLPGSQAPISTQPAVLVAVPRLIASSSSLHDHHPGGVVVGVSHPAGGAAAAAAAMDGEGGWFAVGGQASGFAQWQPVAVHSSISSSSSFDHSRSPHMSSLGGSVARSESEMGLKRSREESGDDEMSGLSKRRRGKLPDKATKTLKNWLLTHTQHPYPSEEEKTEISRATGLSIIQINNWFSNARRRVLKRAVNIGLSIDNPEQVAREKYGSTCVLTASHLPPLIPSAPAPSAPAPSAPAPSAPSAPSAPLASQSAPQPPPISRPVLAQPQSPSQVVKLEHQPDPLPTPLAVHPADSDTDEEEEEDFGAKEIVEEETEEESQQVHHDHDHDHDHDAQPSLHSTLSPSPSPPPPLPSSVDTNQSTEQIC